MGSIRCASRRPSNRKREATDAQRSIDLILRCEHSPRNYSHYMRANIAYLAAMYSLTVGNEEGARNILLRIIKTVPERYDPEKAGFDRRTICRNDPLKPEKEAFRQYHPRFDHEKMKAMFFDERGKARGDN